jgi:hypothetical protein
MKHKFILLFVLVFFQASTILAQGCSQCKLLAQQGSEVDEASFGTNINSGILYLMIIPYLLLLFLFRKQVLGFLKRLFTSAQQS